MIVDKPLAELKQYRPSLTQQADFDSFWEQTVAESNRQPLNATLEEISYPARQVRVYRLQFDGFGSGTRVNAWYMVPTESSLADNAGKRPAIVHYHGYSGSKGRPTSYLHWALQGYNVLAVDTRGQDGDTPDNHLYPQGSAVGFMTRGINDPLHYFYRFAYMDCLRAVNFLRTQPEIGPVAVTGGSQGGGLTLAVAALGADQQLVAAMADVPYLCHFQRAVEVFSTGPYQELVNHWKTYPGAVENNFRTLSYFDGMNFASRIRCPVLLSVGLLDTTCPPSTGFAVYNHLEVEKDIKIYPFNGHEGGSTWHEEEKYRFLSKHLGLEG
jgi:cephalosporin-C deacetylase